MSRIQIELAEACALLTDGTHYTPPDLGKGIPFLTVKDVSESGLDFQHCSKISETEFKKADAGNSAPKLGDVLFSKDGTVGKVHVVKESQLFAVLSSLAILRPNELLDADYLGHVLKSPLISRQASKNKTGSALRRIILSDIKKLKIPCPPLPEQKHISSILDKANVILRKRQQAIQLADKFLRAVFLDMFGDPITNPKGWKVKNLKELSTKIGSGATPRGGKSAYIEEGISLIRSLNVHDDKFLHKNLAFINKKQADALSNVEVKENDILLNITGASVCRCVIVDNTILPARVNQHVCIIRTKKLLPEYLLHMLISGPYKHHLMNIAASGGATREALTKAQVEELLIPVPPEHLQEKFAEITQKIKSIINFEKKTVDLPLFNSLSQKAFSGKL